jgi:hypothetical protein
VAGVRCLKGLLERCDRVAHLLGNPARLDISEGSCEVGLDGAVDVDFDAVKDELIDHPPQFAIVDGAQIDVLDPVGEFDRLQ